MTGHAPTCLIWTGHFWWTLLPGSATGKPELRVEYELGYCTCGRQR
jgi:hypothetical protein